MTNSFNKMAGKNSAERNGTPGRPRSTTKLRPIKVPNNTYINSIATPPRSKSISIPNGNNNNVNNTEAINPHHHHHQQQHQNNMITKQRLTPSPPTAATTVSTPKSYGSSPSRTSPGLMAGHFAGGKWTEPPSPASLPKPPQHWTQLIFNNNCSKFANGKPQQQTDIASQLKVLLNVQA